MMLVIPGVLKPDEVQGVLRELEGGAYEDGRVSAGLIAREIKNNLQVKRDAEAMKTCGPMMLEALRRNGSFYSAALPHRIHGPIFNRYDVGMTYGLHVDNAIMGGEEMPVRTDVSATLFLSAPEQYDGGELVIQENVGDKRVKLPAGSMLVYSSTSAHRVEPVTRGSRLAAIFWVQSMVRDEPKREILYDLSEVLAALRGRVGMAELSALGAVYHNLLRVWADT
ncbi:MAG: Fe2+-dependent dioxygenase [Burkholderiales bacterium]